MAQLGKLLRWFFAVNTLLFAAMSARALWILPVVLESRWNGFAGVILEPVGYLGMALIYGVAFWKLRTGGEDARWLALGASAITILYYLVAQVALFWPAAGLVGLVIFWRRDTVQAMAIPKSRQSRVRGDGTSPQIDGFSNLAMIAGCVSACYFWAGWAARHGLPSDDRIFLWVLYIEIATVMTTIVHESGHAIAAIVLRMKLRRFVAGPITGSFRGGKWKFEFSLMGLLGGPGSVGVVPVDTGNLRNRHAMVAASGPIASLLLGAAAAWAAIASKGQAWESAWRLLAFISTFSLMSFAFNLVPSKPESIYSDGARILQLLRKGPWADVHLALSMASCTLASPTRPRDLDLAVFERAITFLTTGMEALLLRVELKCCYHDLGRIPDALNALASAERVHAESELNLRADLHKSFVYDNAVLKGDAAAARLWWDRMEAKKNATPDATYWMSYSALNWIEGNLEEAQVAWEMSQSLMRECPQAGAYDYDRDCLAQLGSLIRAKVAVPA